MTVYFIGKEYSIPTDVVLYVDLLAFTETAKDNLLKTFLNKIKYSIDRIEDKNFLEQEIYNEAQRFIAKLCENNIYNRTANDYLNGNKGYEFFHTANQDALNRILTLRKARNAAYEAGVQDAIYRKESSVTGLDFGIISGSFVNHMIYASMNASKEKEQEAAALKQYNKEIAELEKSVTSACEASEREYINNIYIPSIKLAFTALVYGWLDSYVRDLIQNGSFDSEALKHIDLERSNDLLKNLSVSTNKTAVLENAFLSCPYNLQIYLETVKLGILDAPTVETAECFRQRCPLIEKLNQQFSEKKPSHNLRRDFETYDLLISSLCLCTKKPKKAYYREFTNNVYADIITAYRKIMKQADDAEHCIPLIDALGRRVLSITEVQLTEYVKNYVNSVVFDEKFAVLVDVCGYDTLLEQITSKAASENNCTTKADVDAFYIERILKHIKPMVTDRKRTILAQDAKQKETEEKRKIECIKAQKKYTIVMILLLVLPMILNFILVGSWCGKVKNIYSDQIEQGLNEELADKSSLCYKARLTGEFEVAKISYYKSRFGYMIAEIHLTVYTTKTNVETNITSWDVHELGLHTTTKGMGAPWYIFDGDAPYIHESITVVGADGSKVTFDEYTPDEDEHFMFVYLPLGVAIFYGIYCFIVVIVINKKKKEYTIQEKKQ